ncbi:unnamed protein product [Musa acuminata subsp. burmannicoides]
MQHHHAPTAGNGKSKTRPHFVLVPFLAQGHMIPMADMAVLLAERGARVSFITTPVNVARTEAVVRRVRRAGIAVEFVELTFPCAEVGLPEGCERIDLLPSYELIKQFHDATGLLRHPLTQHLRAQRQPPTCMIADSCNPWTKGVAEELRMPYLLFHGPSCLNMLCARMILRHKIYEQIGDPFEPFDVPGLPHRLEISMAQMAWFITMLGWEKFREEVWEAETAADGFVINTFEALEATYVECYSREAKGKKVWTIGPLSLSNQDPDDKAARGNKASVDKHRILRWLDEKAPRSVVYVSFGSIVRHSPAQVLEIGRGLEASGRAFLWVIKEVDASSPEVEKWLSGGGFQERVGDKGLIIEGWAPQAAILSHPAIGGFVTHCGWNSVVEAVRFKFILLFLSSSYQIQHSLALVMQHHLAPTTGNGESKTRPHFVLVPFLAQGHMIPMADMAVLLAERGARVSFITTPVNVARTEAVVRRVRRACIAVEFVELTFPCAEVGLPEGCERIDLLPSYELLKQFHDATGLLRHPLTQHLRAQRQPPTCMIADSCNPWTKGVAEELRMPYLLFHGPSCLNMLCARMILRHKIYEQIGDPFEPFDVPGLPHRLEISMAQTAWFITMPGWEKFREEVWEAETAADGFVINTFEALEATYVECYSREAKGKKVWTIGPLSLSNQDPDDKAARGNKASVDKHRILLWLDEKAPRSVVYVSFGSIVRHSPAQVLEIGRGLEASGQAFLWVIKEVDASSPEVEKWLSGGGFQERVGDKGLIIKGWAPQAAILSHPAVGGFVTHCGWNSVVEAVSEGVPMATWPHFSSDQYINERLIVDVQRTGVAVGVTVPDNHVGAEEIEKAVLRLMDGGEKGEGRRKRARELGRKAKEAMEVGGSSYANVTQLIHYASHHDQARG